MALVFWPDGDEVSLGHLELFGGPADYERLEDAGLMSPKLADERLVARIRALRYGPSGRATGAPVSWEQISEWNGGEAPEALQALGATRTGAYGELNAAATRFRAEPAVEVPAANPTALFAAYALTRVMPIMIGFGRAQVEGPNA